MGLIPRLKKAYGWLAEKLHLLLTYRLDVTSYSTEIGDGEASQIRADVVRARVSFHPSRKGWS